MIVECTWLFIPWLLSLELKLFRGVCSLVRMSVPKLAEEILVQFWELAGKQLKFPDAVLNGMWIFISPRCKVVNVKA